MPDHPMTIPADARGVYPIAPTPFLDDGSIDFESVDRLTDFYLASGAMGITVLGQLGEAPKLEHAESVAVARRMIERAPALPVVVGVSAPGFAAMRALTREVMDLGAAGVMIAPPNTLRTDDQIVGYYRQAVEAIGGDVPFVLQDYPLTFTVQMTPGVIRRIVTELPSCAMLKHEDWPGLDKISALRGWERDGSMRHVAILCGNNGLFLDYELERGADGANTGYAFPDMLCDVVRLAAGRPPRGGARPVRRPPAAAALRAAARRGPDRAQVHPEAARLVALSQAARAGGSARRDGARRSRAPARAPRPPRPARSARLSAQSTSIETAALATQAARIGVELREDQQGAGADDPGGDRPGHVDREVAAREQHRAPEVLLEQRPEHVAEDDRRHREIERQEDRRRRRRRRPPRRRRTGCCGCCRRRCR